MSVGNTKSRITNVEVTVVQKPNIAASRNRAVIDFGAPFLLLFWRSKKVKKEIAYSNNKKN